MKPICTQRIYALLFILWLLPLGLPGCQQDKKRSDPDSGENTAALSHGDSARSQQNAIILRDQDGGDYNPVIDPANFVSTIDNPYFTLTPGRIWIYQGTNEDGKTERVEVEVTPDTKTVLGITASVVRERVWEEGELTEDTFDWYAQDRGGNVWYLGEESKEIEEGKIVSTEGSWEAGVNGARAGIIMKAHPQPGDAYRQEFLKGEAEDMGQVLSLDETVTIGLGTYEHCLQVKDWTPLEPDIVEHKFYSKEVGNVLLEKNAAGESGQIELIEMKTR